MTRPIRVAAAVGAVGLQLIVLYVPKAPSVATGGLPLDKLVHVAVFALPTVALVIAGLPRGPVIAIMAVHAPISEMVQHFLLPNRSGDVRDVLADLTGIALAAWWLRAHRRDEAPVPT